MVNIPFFSKKTKKLLKENEDRIFLLVEEEQEKLLSDPQFKPEAKIKQLLKENNELKLLHDELQSELHKKLKAGEPIIFEMRHGVITVHQIKEHPDHTIEFGKGKKKRIIERDNDPSVLKWPGFFFTKQFPVYFVEFGGENTYIPLDETPIEIKKRVEGSLKTGLMMKKMNFVDNVMAGLKNLKKWWDYLPWIATTILVLGTVIAFVWLISGYNLIKTGG